MANPRYNTELIYPRIAPIKDISMLSPSSTVTDHAPLFQTRNHPRQPINTTEIIEKKFRVISSMALASFSATVERAGLPGMVPESLLREFAPELLRRENNGWVGSSTLLERD